MGNLIRGRRIKPISVLLVEDDVVDQMTVERAFGKGKFVNKLYKAENGIEALEYMRGENGKKKITQPYVVLLDLNMPKMNGLEFLEEVRKDSDLNKIPVVVLTSSVNEEDISESYKQHVAGYIPKPVELGDFVEKMANFGTYWAMCELYE
jgi:CheY-like chemotaxis protein